MASILTRARLHCKVPWISASSSSVFGPRTTRAAQKQQVGGVQNPSFLEQQLNPSCAWPSVQQQRFLSSNASSSSMKMNPSYQVYGEESALTIKAMLPEFRVFGAGTVVLDSRKRGRLLFEWTPRNADGKFNWDGPMRFALSAEEAGLLLARIPSLQPTEFVRKAATASSGSQSQFSDVSMSVDAAEKVFRAIPKEDGSVEFRVDFESKGVGGQQSPSRSNEPVRLRYVLCNFLSTFFSPNPSKQ
jgi:hypothetical protein